MDKYEIAIIGLGAMGAAAAYQLAKRGVKVLGLDQFAPILEADRNKFAEQLDRSRLWTLGAHKSY